MAGYLDPIVQDIVVNATEAIAELLDVAKAMTEAAGAAADLTGREHDLLPALAEKSGAARAQAGTLDHLRNALTATAFADVALIRSQEALRDVMYATSAAVAIQRGRADDLRDAFVTTVQSVRVLSGAEVDLMRDMTIKSGAARTQKGVLDALSGQMGRTALMAGALGKAETLAGAKTTIMAGALVGAGRTIVGTNRVFGLTRNALHWIVMGSLEIAATAIPAIVAFGGAVAGMYPTFVHIYDQMNNLVTASGSMKNAFLNSVGPLHNIGVNMGNLAKAMAPDAYIAFGSVINALGGHFGLFARMAKSAGTVLAGFATKVTQDLQGPMGTQLVGFFKDSVKFMIQWGQVLGNIGHIFINVMGAMPGVAHLVLDAFVGITRVLVAITSNPVGAWFIGVAAGMSAAYRYAKLLSGAWKFLGGPAIVTAIKAIIGALAGAGYAFMAADGAIAGFRAALATLWASIGPVGWAILALGFALGIWYALTRSTGDATDALIKKVQSATPTFSHLASGVHTLAEGMLHLGRVVHPGFWQSIIPGGGAGFLRSLSDLSKLQAAIKKQAQEYVNLATGMGQAGGRAGLLGHNMNALAIQTGLADSKVTQLNQAWDQYMQLVTGGTGGLASFAQSIANIGQVAGTTANNLGTATGSMTLNVNQFAQALAKGPANASGAWTNFDQLLGSTMPQLVDWFRNARVAGAIGDAGFSKSVLDMAAVMVKFAKDSPTAQKELVAFAQAAGLPIKNFTDLRNMIHKTGAGMPDLQKKTDAATKALANMSKISQNLGNTLNGLATSAIATAALKASGFDKTLNTLTNDIANGLNPNSTTARRLVHLMGQELRNAGQIGGTVAGGMVTDGRKMAQGMVPARQAIITAFRDFLQLKGGWNAWNPPPKTLSVTTFFKNVGYTTPAPGLPGGPGPYTGGAKTTGASLVGGHVTVGGGTHVHVYGSVISGQQVGQVVQSAVNRKTVRNGSTQLFLATRRH